MREVSLTRTTIRGAQIGLLVALMAATAFTAAARASTLVTIDTNFGNIELDLFNDVAPTTVTNFVNLVTAGDYSNSIIHRSIPNFVIQGGGFNTSSTSIPNNGTIPLEYKIANTRGTISMARLSSPNTANSQFFINTVDNTTTLGPGGSSTDGYAAFGWVLSGMDVVDAIAALPTYNLSNINGAFTNLPLQNYTQGNPLSSANEAVINSISIAEQHPSYQNPIWNVDVNNDGKLSTADVMVIVNSILANGPKFSADSSKISNTYKYFDTNGDNFVSLSDLMTVVNAILRGDTAPASLTATPLAMPLVVPEPSSAVLSMAACLALGTIALRRRKRRRGAAKMAA